MKPTTLHNTMRTAILACVAALCLGAFAAAGPYDETADAKAQLKAALNEASRSKRPVLLVFGANWCGDCKVLDIAFKEGATAALISKGFQVVKVDVGKFDRNVDLADSHGVPLKSGIPAVAVLSFRGEVVYATRAGELADARHMGDAGLYDFFARVLAATTR